MEMSFRSITFLHYYSSKDPGLKFNPAKEGNTHLCPPVSCRGSTCHHRDEMKEDWHMHIFSQRDRMKPNIAFYVQPFICRITTCGKSKWFSPQVPKLKAGKEGDLGARSSPSPFPLNVQVPENKLREHASRLKVGPCAGAPLNNSQFQLAPCNRVRYEWDNACGSKFKIILCTWHFYMLPYI